MTRCKAKCEFGGLRCSLIAGHGNGHRAIWPNKHYAKQKKEFEEGLTGSMPLKQNEAAWWDGDD